MTATQLRDNLTTRGFSLRVDRDSNMVFVKPSNRLEEADRAGIRSLKPELLKLLADPPADPPPDGAPDAPDATRASSEIVTEFDAGAAYDPEQARAHALSDETLTPEQRANLLRYTQTPGAMVTAKLSR